MSRHEDMVEFIRTGRGRGFISAQFGLEWVAQCLGKPAADLEDYLYVCGLAGVDNFVGVGKDPGAFLPALQWKETHRKPEGDGVLITQTLETPVGVLNRVIERKPGQDVWTPVAPVKCEDDLRVVEWYAEQARTIAAAVRENLRKDVALIAGRAMADFAVLLPFEMYYFVSYPDMPVMYLDYRDAYHRAMDAIQETNKTMAEAALEAGVPMICMGSAGYEMLSPGIFREALVPYAKDICAFVRERGGLTHYHMCGHSLEIARSGYFNEIRPDVLETLSPPPCGVVKDLAGARAMIDSRICTRGNLPVELLRSGPVDRIAEETRQLVRLTRNWKHIVGIADTLLPGTPLEHVQAMTQAAKEELANGRT